MKTKFAVILSIFFCCTVQRTVCHYLLCKIKTVMHCDVMLLAWYTTSRRWYNEMAWGICKHWLQGHGRHYADSFVVSFFTWHQSYMILCSLNNLLRECFHITCFMIKVLLNQAHSGRRPTHAWFLNIYPVWIISMCVCVFMCVCVSTLEAINN